MVWGGFLAAIRRFRTGLTVAGRLEALHGRIRSCRICADRPDGSPLPHDPNPVVVPSARARIAICGQAPGTRVHASGIPFTDPSGDRLRDWLGVTEKQFYDPSLFAIVPMGFCFPGLDAKGGDLPPRPECARNWHGELFNLMPQIELKLVIGQYAQAWHLGKRRGRTLSLTVRNWRAFLKPECGEPASLPLPHPSWRNNAWLSKNPWFESELLPELRKRIQQFIA